VLDRDERRRAAVELVLDLMQATETNTPCHMSRKIDVAQNTISRWTARSDAKCKASAATAETIDRILNLLPADKATPAFRAKMHRLAARTCGYEV